MNHALVIARRELRDRSRLFVLAAAIAFIPFIASLMPGARGYQSDIIAMGGAILGVALGLGTAITLGNTTIGRELSERRLSFYFAKPLSPAALWTGKAAAALVSSLACFLIVIVPAFLAVQKTWNAGTFFSAPAILLGGVVGIVVLFFVSHAVSTVIRSRSPLIALDVAALAIAVGAIYLILRPVALTGSIRHTGGLLLVVLGAMLVLLVVVPVGQLATGRTDARRGHAAFSRAWWPAVAVVIAGAGIYAAWLVRPALSDITYVNDLQRAPAGDWVAVTGQTRNRGRLQASFMTNAASGETIRLPQSLWWGSTFSRDGRAVAWIQPASLKPNGQYLLHVRRLDEARVRDTGIPLSSNAFVLSDDASRVAVLQKQLLAVYDVATGKLVASAAAPATSGRFFFASPNVVRLYHSGNDGMQVFELDAATRSFRQTGQFPKDALLFGTSADGSRAYVRHAILDGRTGATIATLPEWKPELSRSRMLSDGSVVRSGFEGGKAIVKIFNADGTARHEVVLPGVKHTLIAGDTADGKLIVLASRAIREGQKVFVLDPKRGVIEQVREGLIGPFAAWETDPRATPFRGELASVDVRAGKPVLWKHTDRAAPRPLF